MGEGLGRRERKKQATRRALVDAATELFTERGFDQTTVAQIADRADVSTRTFFLHFPTKESVLADEGDARLRLGLDALAAGPPGERPFDALARAVHRMIDGDPADGPSRWSPFRAAGDTPSLRPHALRQRLEIEERLAAALRDAFPNEVDDVRAAAAVGAVAAAVYAAALGATARGEAGAQVRAALHRAVDVGLAIPGTGS